jgi:TonB-linked SusC/RagA family outer membrane protein
MKNSILSVVLITGFLLTFFNAYSQEFESESLNEKIKSETVDLGFGIIQNKATSTASTATVKADVLEQRAAINLQDALYGRLLGLTALRNSGEQGGWVGAPSYGASFNIRGIQTTTGENSILILVDGLPRTIDLLALDEIESVTVLKDAAALALHGYTGINGAISVKTKRSPQTGTSISAKYHHKFTFGATIPEYADSYTYALAMNEARRLDGFTSPAYNDYELNAFKNGTHPLFYPNVNWKEEAMRDVGTEDILSLSYAHSSQNMRFFSMLNYTSSNGLLKGTETNWDERRYSTQLKYSKANLRMNMDVDLTPTTQMEVNLLGIFYESNRPYNISPDSLFLALHTLPSAVYPVKTHDGIWGGSNAFQTTNPVARIEETGYTRILSPTINADFKLTQRLDQLLEGLSVSGRFGYDSHNRAFENRRRGYAWASNRFTFDQDGNVSLDDDGNPRLTRQSGGAVTNELLFNRSTSFNSRNLNLIFSADYKKQLDGHGLAASLIYHDNQSVRTRRHTTYFRKSFMSYLHYDWLGKYIADAVLAYTGSNRSYPQSWAFSPTVSLGWIISEEDFLKGSNTLNFLKLRTSFGRHHTDYVPRDGAIWMAIYGGSSGNFPFSTPAGGWNSHAGLRQDYLPTTSFKLETANKFNVGLDALLLHNLGLTFDAFYQRRENILMSESGLHSAIVGIIPAYTNQGIVDSKGFEVGLNYSKKFFNDLTVSASGMYTFAKNKVIDIVEEPKAFPWLELKGRRVGQFRGLEAIGFFEDENDIRNSPQQEFSIVRPCDVKYKDQNNDGIINDNDFVSIGYSSDVPEINYAFSFGLEYKGLGFNILFQGVANYSTYYVSGYHTPLVLNRNISMEYYNNRWIEGQDNSGAKYPRLSSLDNPNNNQNSAIWYKDASFLKLRNCELYYKVSKLLLERSFIADLKLSVRGENLYTWSKFDEIDPEINTRTSSYPMLKGVSVGLSASF